MSRDLHTIYAAARAALAAAAAEPVVTLRELSARVQLREPEARELSADEVRAIVDLALAGTALPPGILAEAAIAYECASRRDADCVPAAVARLQALGGTERDTRDFAEWLRYVGHQQLAQAERLSAEIAKRGTH